MNNECPTNPDPAGPCRLGRITPALSPSGWILHVEGELSGSLVDQLERCWQDAGGTGPIAIDLTGTTFISAAGRALLTSFHRAGVRFVAAGCANREIVAQITGS